MTAYNQTSVSIERVKGTLFVYKKSKNSYKPFVFALDTKTKEKIYVINILKRLKLSDSPSLHLKKTYPIKNTSNYKYVTIISNLLKVI